LPRTTCVVSLGGRRGCRRASTGFDHDHQHGRPSGPEEPALHTGVASRHVGSTTAAMMGSGPGSTNSVGRATAAGPPLSCASSSDVVGDVLGPRGAGQAGAVVERLQGKRFSPIHSSPRTMICDCTHRDVGPAGGPAKERAGRNARHTRIGFAERGGDGAFGLQFVVFLESKGNRRGGEQAAPAWARRCSSSEAGWRCRVIRLLTPAGLGRGPQYLSFLEVDFWVVGHDSRRSQSSRIRRDPAGAKQPLEKGTASPLCVEHSPSKCRKRSSARASGW